MLQIKKFALSSAGVEKEINEWIEVNYSKIEMRSDGKGPALSIYGSTDPILVVQYDRDEKYTEEYYRQALAEEVQLRNVRLFKSIQQLEEHREKLRLVPEFGPAKGKHGSQRSAAWVEHSNGVEMTKRDILLQKAEVRALNNILSNLAAAVSGTFEDSEMTMSPSERELAGSK